MNPLPTLFFGKKNKGTICSNSPHEKMESCLASSPRPFLVMIVEGLVREVTGGWVEPSNWVLAVYESIMTLLTYLGYALEWLKD